MARYVVLVSAGILFAVSLFSLSFFSSSSLPLFPSAEAMLYTPAPFLEYAGPPSILTIISPFNGEAFQDYYETHVQLYYLLDDAPLQYVQLKVDNGPWEYVPLSDVRIVYPVSEIDGVVTPGRMFQLTSRFNWKLDGVNFTSPGVHTLQARVKTSASMEIMSPVSTFTAFAGETVSLSSSDGVSPLTALFAGAFEGLDCKKNPKCTHTLRVYIPMVQSDSSQSWADRKLLAEKAIKKAEETIVNKACVSFKIEWVELSLPDGVIPGFNPSTNYLTNAEDFIHFLHTDPGVSVIDEGTLTEKSFSDELGSSKKDGPVSVIMPEEFIQFKVSPDGSLSSRIGLTFNHCGGVVDNSSCTKYMGSSWLIAPSSSEMTVAHEYGHASFYGQNWSDTDESGTDTHHSYDFKTTDPLPADNFMGGTTDGLTVPTVTEKQAEALYASCKESGGLVGMDADGSSTNYCVLDNPFTTEIDESACLVGGGSLSVESCWGNTARGWKPKVPSNFKPPSQGGVDICPVDNDCPVGTVCSVETCHCYPAWWPSPSGPTGQSTPDPTGNSSGSTGGNTGVAGGVKSNL